MDSGSLASGGHGVYGLRYYNWRSLMQVLVKSFEEAFWDPTLYSDEMSSELISFASSEVHLEDLNDSCWRNIFTWFLNLEGFGLLACTLSRLG